MKSLFIILGLGSFLRKDCVLPPHPVIERTRVRLNRMLCHLDLRDGRRNLFRFATLPLLLLVLSGCEAARKHSLTYRLWTNGEMNSYCEPAGEPNLALFEATNRADILVLYNAVSEKHGGVHRRAYLLHRETSRVSKRKRPHFVNAEAARGQRPIPVLERTPADSAGDQTECAIPMRERGSFTLYRRGEKPSSYELPVYQERSGTFLRTALTPFAVAGDTVMVGGVAAVVAFVWWVEGGAFGINNYDVR